ncbi:MAG: response regulator transcription factor [Clostridia bacterium]|nr:response regulator transcription factor [Clostridia bacterium]MCQ2479552.1 response regulator transcription factor [Clostridia bacterium]
MYRVLVCDDDTAIVDSIEIYLKHNGYDVIKAYDGIDAIEKAENNEIHCMILDIMMPKMDGLMTAGRLREKHNFPIIMLSAKSEDTDKIIGLDFGADDYVTKPFNPLELMARVKSQIRRYAYLGNLTVKESQLVNGGIVLDKDTKEVTVDGTLVHFTAREFGILQFLLENAGRVLSSSQIYEAVWGEPAYGVERVITVHIKNIRSKIEINPKDPKYLKVIYGLGYKIEKF